MVLIYSYAKFPLKVSLPSAQFGFEYAMLFLPVKRKNEIVTIRFKTGFCGLAATPAWVQK